jgi:replication factor C small subunit
MAFFENEEEEKKDHFIWAEKYRPNNLSEYLGNDQIKDSVRDYIKAGEIPHLLFYSRKPGTGKTTVAKMLAKSIPCDFLYINASDERKLDDIRDKVSGFASTLGFQKLKILVLDECDQITPAGQMALRNLMETFAEHTRFILTCNYHEKLIEPLVSRCQSFHVQPPSKAEVAKHVAKILDKEGVTYEMNDFKVLMKYYPDIRRIIQTAQQNSISGKLNIDETQVVESDAKIKLLELLKSSSAGKDKLKNCRKLLADNGVGDYTEYFDYLYENIDELAPGATSNVITTLADFQYKDAFVPNKEMNFAACLVELLKAL